MKLLKPVKNSTMSVFVDVGIDGNHTNIVSLLSEPRARQHSFVEIGHDISSAVILSLSLIQEG